MTKKSYTGKVWAQVVEVRFAFSGRIATVNKFTGTRIKKGETLASLDRKILQTELDRQLADYEKQRAQFEIFGQKNPHPTDEITKYLKTAQQADLNISVKDVELAKAKLDQAGLFSPVTGVVLDDGNNVPGLYVTPSSSPFLVLNTENVRFRLEVDEGDLTKFLTSAKAKVTIPALKKDFSGSTLEPVATPNQKAIIVDVILSDAGDLLPGLTGSLQIL